MGWYDEKVWNLKVYWTRCFKLLITKPSRRTSERLFICPHWSPYFESLCRQGNNYGGQYRDVWGFSRGSPVSSISSHQYSSLFKPTPSSCHFIFSYINFMSSFTSFTVTKNSCFGASPVYNREVGGGGEEGRSPSAPPLVSETQWTSSRAT